MINKLLDEPYWNELPCLIDQSLNDKPFYIEVPAKLMAKWRGIYNPVAQAILKGKVYETEDFLCVYAFAPFKIKQKRKLWNKNQVTHWMLKHLPELRENIVYGIDQQLQIQYTKYTDPETRQLINSLKKENNLHVLFCIYQNLINQSYITTKLDVESLKAPFNFSPKRTPIYDEGGFFLQRVKE